MCLYTHTHICVCNAGQCFYTWCSDELHEHKLRNKLMCLNPNQAGSCRWPWLFLGTAGSFPRSPHTSTASKWHIPAHFQRGVRNKSAPSPSNSASRPFVPHKIDRDLCSHCLCATSSMDIKPNLRFLAFRFTRHLSWQLRKTSLTGYLTVWNHAIRNFWENQSKAVALQNCQTDTAIHMPPKYLLVLVVWIWSGSNFWH